MDSQDRDETKTAAPGMLARRVGEALDRLKPTDWGVSRRRGDRGLRGTNSRAGRIGRVGRPFRDVFKV